jgi:hypothetical protein
MKKAVILIVSVVFFLGIISTANADFYTGEYSGQPIQGKWYESYDGDGPGKIGNYLYAESDSMVTKYSGVGVIEEPTWIVMGLYINQTIDLGPSPDGKGELYQTLYGGSNGVGGGYGYYIDPSIHDLDVWLLSDLHAVVLAEINGDGSYNHGQVTLTGSQSFGNHDLLFSLTANLYELGPWTNNNDKIPGHYGIINTPEPATMMLLGLGLIGLAGIRRKLGN